MNNPNFQCRKCLAEQYFSPLESLPIYRFCLSCQKPTAWVLLGESTELTDEQIGRQDFVDNAIFALVNELVPEKFRLTASADEIPFDGGWIGDVRDRISEVIAEHLEIIPGTPKCDEFEMEFYPFVEEK